MTLAVGICRRMRSACSMRCWRSGRRLILRQRSRNVRSSCVATASSKVTGDRYAGEWPVARFREHGIAFEQSARPKSDLYHDLLPLLNAQRVELLDSQRLLMQLVGLERRVSRQGKDRLIIVLVGMTTLRTALRVCWSGSIWIGGLHCCGRMIC